MRVRGGPVLLSLLVAVSVSGIAHAQVFPYAFASAYGDNNERDVVSQACDFILGCFDKNGNLCSNNPTETCELQPVPEGRCAAGDAQNLWPRRAGQCEGTEGYFQKGALLPEAVLFAGIPCLADAYAQALKVHDADFLSANETANGPSSFCPVGVNHGGTSTTFPDATGICDMFFNRNRANCQTDDPNGNILLGAGVGTGGPTFETDICGSPGGRCSDGDPLHDLGGLGDSFCSDFGGILGQIDPFQLNCGDDAGTDGLASPRSVLENPPDLFTAQRNPGTGFVGAGPIRPVRRTMALQIEDATAAAVNSLGIRRVSVLGDSVWKDPFFNAKESNGSFDTTTLVVACDPPEGWETQLPVEGNCSEDAGVFCFKDHTCSSQGKGTCVNRVYCHEAAPDAIGFLWQRDIVDHEPVPAAKQALSWSTDPLNPTCPPLCGTAYHHTTLESEAIQEVGTEDRASGIQLVFDSLRGRRAGAGDFLSVDDSKRLFWVNEGDVRCRIGGQDPSDPVNIGTCTSSLLKCNVATGVPCSSLESCVACGGTHTTEDPVKGTADALPPGYDDQNIPALKLGENRRFGVLNQQPITVGIKLFRIRTTGAAGAVFTDNTCASDRCMLGQCSVFIPGSVGIGDTGRCAASCQERCSSPGTACQNDEDCPGGEACFGGCFAAGQTLPTGGQNTSGEPVCWKTEDSCGPSATAPFVEVKSYGVGPDGIPGCFGDNRSENSAAQACRKRLGRGNELESAWGFCETNRCFNGNLDIGGSCTTTPDCPTGFDFCEPMLCESGVSSFYCGAEDCTVALDPNDPNDWLFQTNTGKDDPEILIPIEDPNTLASGIQARFLIPNPSAPAPILHGVSAWTLRDLNVIDPASFDAIGKSDFTLCPIDPLTGELQCGGAEPCADLGGDTDGDGNCDDGPGDFCTGGETTDCKDNCKFKFNPHQEDTGGVGTSAADGIGNACQCGDVTGDGVTNGTDATFIERSALGLHVAIIGWPPSVLCDVTGDGQCNGTDATFIRRAALGLFSPLFGQNCPPATNPICVAWGGDTDGDGFCDDGPGAFCNGGETENCKDNCRFIDNPNQEDTNADGIGDACQCGDVTGDGLANGTDSTFITRRALGLFSPLFNVPGNCDVTGDGQCNGIDATFIGRCFGGGLFWFHRCNNCPNFTGSCEFDNDGNCL
jgi:hypothetical protein